MSGKTSRKDHLRTINNLTEQLGNIGVIIPDDELVNRMLTSLFLSLHVFCQIIYSQEYASTFEVFENLLVHEDAIQAKDLKCDEQEEVFATQHETIYMVNPCGDFSYCSRGCS